MKKMLTAAAVATAGLLGALAPASAITRGGVPDGDAHPYVGLMVAQDADGNPLWRCTGTLVSETLFVTAGHCTESPAAHVEIWFQSDLESGIPGNGYPFDGQASGTPFTHPDYDPDAFFLVDLGAVVLDAPHTPEGGEFGALPTVGLVDTLEKGRSAPGVTTVGYGLQRAERGIHPAEADRVRYRADLMIANTKGAYGTGSTAGLWSMKLSGDAKHGGTCFGDSGGPTFVHGTNVVVAVTSFGVNARCAGGGGVYRIDSPFALEWLNSLD